MTIAEERSLATIEGEFRTVRPLVDTAAALATWRSYQELTRAILDPSDFQSFNEGGKVRRFIKRSGHRKLATHYGISIRLKDERLGHKHDGAICARVRFPEVMRDEKDCGCPLTFARYVIEAIAPNGRVVEGIGICSTGERRSFTRQDHDLPATAYTRAVNRAISDLIGAGEISAEEVRGSAAVSGLAREDKDAIAAAWRAANSAQRETAEALLREWGFVGPTRRDLFSDFNLRAAEDQVSGLLNELGSDELPFDPEAVPGPEPLPTQGGRS